MKNAFITTCKEVADYLLGILFVLIIVGVVWGIIWLVTWLGIWSIPIGLIIAFSLRVLYNYIEETR
jgi:cobalamin biosynthesis protein CobD/CbiB